MHHVYTVLQCTTVYIKSWARENREKFPLHFGNELFWVLWTKISWKLKDLGWWILGWSEFSHPTHGDILFLCEEEFTDCRLHWYTSPCRGLHVHEQKGHYKSPIIPSWQDGSPRGQSGWHILEQSAGSSRGLWGCGVGPCYWTAWDGLACAAEKWSLKGPLLWRPCPGV